MKALLEIKSSLKLIKDNEQYKECLASIDNLIDFQEGSFEKEGLELVSILAETYEIKHFSIKAIKIRMIEEGLKKKDLAKYFGNASRVSEVLNRKDLSRLI